MGGKFNDRVGVEITKRIASLVSQDALEEYMKLGVTRYPIEISEGRVASMLDTANSLYDQGVLNSPCVRVRMRTKFYDMPMGCYLLFEKDALRQIFDAARAKVNPIAEKVSNDPHESSQSQWNADIKFTDQLCVEAGNYCLAVAKELAEKNGEPQFRVKGTGGMPDAIPRPANQGCGCTCLVLLIGIIAAVVYFATNT